MGFCVLPTVFYRCLKANFFGIARTMKVKCPTCKKIVEYTAGNVFRPFCSERCQVLDLGAWADELYVVPVSVQDPASVNSEFGGENAPEFELPPKHHLI